MSDPKRIQPDEDDDEGAFVKRRPSASRRPQSILPHQNFLTPRRPAPLATNDSKDRDPPTQSSTTSEQPRTPASAYFYRRSDDIDTRLNEAATQSSERPTHSITQRSSVETGLSLGASSAQHHLGQPPAPHMKVDTTSREPLLPPKTLDRDRYTPQQEKPLPRPAQPRSPPAPSTTAKSTNGPTPPVHSPRTTHPQLAYLCSHIRSPAGNPVAFVLSLALLLALGGVWMGFEARYLWYNLSPAVPIVVGYVWLAAIVNMLVTAYQDPGTVPRDLDPDPPTNRPPSADRDPEDPLYSPLPRIIRVRNGQDLTLKWCETCHVYRPPRSSHCRVCDVCVEGIDHHCTFLNTCIGRRNYTSFFAFLIFSLLTSILCIVFSAVHLKLLTNNGTTSFGRALAISPASAVLFLLILIVFVPIMTLFTYHLRLIVMGRTTVEQIRINTQKAHAYEADKPLSQKLKWTTLTHCKLGIPDEDPNPFAYRDPCRNCCVVLCRPGVATIVTEKEMHG